MVSSDFYRNQILEVCYKSGVKVVTIYAFSIENFKRSQYEVDALMSMVKVKLTQIAQHGDLLDRYGASIRVLGQREYLKPDVLEAIDCAVKLTSKNTDAVLNVCFPYTSRDEITTAVRNTVIEYSTPATSPCQPKRPFSETHITHTIRSRRLSANGAHPRTQSPSSSGTSDAEDSTTSSSSTLLSESPHTPPLHSHEDSDPKSEITYLSPDHGSQTKPDTVSLRSDSGSPSYPNPELITSEVLDSHMFTTGTPPLDLLVRTSGVERLSDFMLWQCHQDTEIVFLKCLWPEFDLWTFLPVLVGWQWRRRKTEEGEKGRKEKMK